VTSISPAAATVGGLGGTLTVTGSSFLPGTEITWNGTARPTLYASASMLQMTINPQDLAGAATIEVGVIDPVADGGQSSNTVPFTISNSVNPNPVPVLNTISPATATAGANATTITLTGSNFIFSSVVEWAGLQVNTTYQSSTSLTAIIPATDLQTAGTVSVTVVNAAPGGGTSNPLTFTVNAAATAGQTVVNIDANDLAWDPVNQVIYLSIPSYVGSNGNTIQVLNPVTGALGQSVFAGSEPDLLSVSANSKYLYASLDGSNAMQRFVLPGLTTDINTSLGSDPFDGPFIAMDLQASPASDGTVAVVRGTPQFSPEEEGGVVIYDNGVARPGVLCGWIQSGCTNTGIGLYDSIQWNTAATQMYALNNEDTGFDYYTIPVTSSGFGKPTDYGGLAGGFGDMIHYDATTQLIYGDDGEVINPATGGKAGEFATYGLGVPDGKLGVMFFLSSSLSGNQCTLSWYDINHFTPIGSMTIKNVVGTPTHLIRWGSNGLAFTTQNSVYNGTGFTTTGAVYLVTGSF
jgi:hypothetical protein